MFWLQATTVYMANKCTSVVQVKKERKNLYTAGLQAAFEKEKQVFSDAPYNYD
jgi:hypothetical protein